MILRAKMPVLYQSRQYSAGDALPVNNTALVNAWIESGAATWVEDTTEPGKPPMAKLTTAEPGLAGKSSDGDPEALVGKVPKRTTGRGKKK